MPSMTLLSHTKNSSTTIGIMHAVTSITARASMKLLRVFCTLLVTEDIPPSTLEAIQDNTPSLSSSVFSLISSVVCLADSIVLFMEEAYVVSIKFDTLRLTGINAKIVTPNNTNFTITRLYTSPSLFSLIV